MNTINKVYNLLEIISNLEKNNSILIKDSLLINTYKENVLDIISKTNTEYDFYQSFKHYIKLSKGNSYFNIYYKMNSRYMPIITDICLRGRMLKSYDYDDYIKVSSGTLKNLTIYCDSSNAEHFYNNSFQNMNIHDMNEFIEFD